MESALISFGSATLKAFVEVFKSTDTQLSDRIVWLIERIQYAPTDVRFEDLVSLSYSKNIAVARWASGILQRYDHKAVISFLSSKDLKIRLRAYGILAAHEVIDMSIGSLILQGLYDESVEVRKVCLASILKLPPNEQVLKKLREFEKTEKDPEIQARVRYAIKNILKEAGLYVRIKDLVRETFSKKRKVVGKE